MSRQYYVDPSRPVGKVVMFGGNKTGGTQADKTWVLEVDDPSEPSYKWSLIQNDGTYEMNCPSSQGYGYPSPRSSPGLAFDGKELVLFGGTPITSDTWFLVLPRGTPPSPRQGGQDVPRPLYALGPCEYTAPSLARGP